MRHTGTLAMAILGVGLAGLTADPPTAALQGDKPASPTALFTLPPGFEIELVAGPPLVDRPITAAFDELGRLYVADSSGSNENVQTQLEKKPHRIVRLEDTDGDGRFDRSTVFADKMMFPEGTMWLDGSLYVAAPPSIWKLTDTDGDGVADQRIEWFQGKTLTGCANDLHGPYLGPDGWIYWCKGAFARQTYERPGKPPFSTRASHIFRSRRDGSGIEPVMTGGMDNPVDVVFTATGERLFTTTFLQHPREGRRDGLIHAIYGGIYGKDHDPIYEHKWTGPALMPVLSHLGPAAPCGLAIYEGSAFGPEYRGNLFACLFNMQKVTRHVLTPDGAGYRSRDEDFLVSSNRDFHPTDVIEDADGSLLVVDTGGWYKLCCPTSQLVKPEVLGGIYRIRKKGAPKLEDPRGLRIAWKTERTDALVQRLSDHRPAVRQRAIETLAARDRAAIPPLAHCLKSDKSAEARRNALWTLMRLEHDEARTLIRQCLSDVDETVRQVALHAISLYRDREAVPQLLKLLAGPSWHNRRGAAEALGRIGEASAVPHLLAALESPADVFLEHSLIFALIEIGDRAATARGLDSKLPSVRRAALIALDQMDNGSLLPEMVAPELAAADRPLREAAWWIVGRRPEWGPALAGPFRARLATADATPAEKAELVMLLARFARSPAIQALLVGTAGDASAPTARLLALRAMAQSTLRELPLPWADALPDILAADNPELLREAIAVVRTAPLPKQYPSEKLTQALLRLGEKHELPADVRLRALAAVPAGGTKLSASVFAFILGWVDAKKPVVERTLAVEALARAALSREQLLKLTEAFAAAGPMEVNPLLEPFARSTDETVGRKLLAALRSAPALAGLRPDALRTRLAKYGPNVQKEMQALLDEIDADAGKQRARLEQILASLGEGDPKRGQAIFNSPKAACSTCHAVGYMGGDIGPDLTRIGRIRTDRDLLESILFPNASFTQGYESVVVMTTAGVPHNGRLRRNSPDEIVLILGANQELRLPRSEIAEMAPSRVSIMPPGLDQQLTSQELADLLAFLKACK